MIIAVMAVSMCGSRCDMTLLRNADNRFALNVKAITGPRVCAHKRFNCLLRKRVRWSKSNSVGTT